MDTVSVSKGVFVFKNGYKPQKRRKSQKTPEKSPFSDELWYNSYKTLWNNLEDKIQVLNNEMFSNVLSNLISFVRTSYDKKVSEIPAATLLTGINMPDHAAQFSTLSKEIMRTISPHVVTLHAQDCNNIKYLVEHMINQLINEETLSDDDDDLDVGMEIDVEGDDKVRTKPKKNKIKKNQCSFAVLQSWYEDFNYGHHKKILAVIMPDFESFNARVLQDFIQIASNYINILPFVLIFGVATSLSALNKSMPYHVSSKVNIQVFNSQPSTLYLNSILEDVILTDKCSFHLGGRLFALFLDVFLFYDFSVTGFIQNFKFAMLEHFSRGSHLALCTSSKNVANVLDCFDHNDFENVRRNCFSFRALVENETPDNQIKLLEDDEYFRSVLELCLTDIYQYMNKLHVFLNCLKILVEDLPKTPLGKQIRELYILATSKDITSLPEFKEAFQLLGFQSKDELACKMKVLITLLLDQLREDKGLNMDLYEEISTELLNLLEQLLDNTSIVVPNGDEDVTMEELVKVHNVVLVDSKLDRKALKEQLLQRSRCLGIPKMNKYEKVRMKLVSYLEKIFAQHLRPPKEFPFYELFFFNDVSIQNNVIGAHRSAIHTALNDPVTYLLCDCCKLPNDASILDSMPDICIAYKLHLEYGKMINLYDWLQAFLSILDPIAANDESDKREVDPHLQARFTQCVAELEYLGFVKSSKRKTDHVARLTWGG